MESYGLDAPPPPAGGFLDGHMAPPSLSAALPASLPIDLAAALPPITPLGQPPTIGGRGMLTPSFNHSKDSVMGIGLLGEPSQGSSRPQRDVGVIGGRATRVELSPSSGVSPTPSGGAAAGSAFAFNAAPGPPPGGVLTGLGGSAIWGAPPSGQHGAKDGQDPSKPWSIW